MDLDDRTFDNKKYVSTSKYDNAFWEDYLVPSFKDNNWKSYQLEYKTLKDIKVADSTVLGESFVKVYMSDKDSTIKDVYKAYNKFNKPISKDISIAKAASISMATQTNTGKKIISDLMDQGYGAVTDAYGQNVAIDPLIIFSPDKNIKLTKQKSY